MWEFLMLAALAWFSIGLMIFTFRVIKYRTRKDSLPVGLSGIFVYGVVHVLLWPFIMIGKMK